MLCNLFHSIMKSSLLAYAPRFIVPFQKREMKKWKCFVLTLNSFKNKAMNFEMRFGHVCLSKNDFPKKINLIFCLFFYYPLLPKASKLIFLHFFTLDKDHPYTGGWCIISPSVSSFVSLGATVPFISFVSHIGG